MSAGPDLRGFILYEFDVIPGGVLLTGHRTDQTTVFLTLTSQEISRIAAAVRREERRRARLERE